MYAETTERKRKRIRRTFFFCLLSKCSIRLYFTERKSKKKVERREESCSTVVTPFFLSLLCVCSSSSPLVFFSVYMRAFGVCKHTSTRERMERQKRRKKKYEAENEWKTHELLLCFLNIDNSEGREREKRRASNYRKKYTRRKKRETKSSGNVC